MVDGNRLAAYPLFVSLREIAAFASRLRTFRVRSASLPMPGWDGVEDSRSRQTNWRYSMDSLVQQVKNVTSDYKRFRWALGLNGALSIAVGVIILLWPGISLFALTILFGAYMTASGIIGLVAAGGGTVQQNRGWLVGPADGRAPPARARRCRRVRNGAVSPAAGGERGCHTSR
jgi:hypothetical protein